MLKFPRESGSLFECSNVRKWKILTTPKFPGFFLLLSVSLPNPNFLLLSVSLPNPNFLLLSVSLPNPNFLLRSVSWPKDMDSFRWFDKQDAALNHCRSQEGDENGVFVLHRFDGRRRFVSCPYSEFCKKYLALDPELCHFFEVIREDIPARLYFDIDVKKSPLFSIASFILIDMLLKCLDHFLYDKFGLRCNQDEVLILDSSSNEKFSLHFIFPKVIFYNNLEVGLFVKAMANTAPDFLFMTTGDESKTSFVSDLSVYTRNRHFRLWKSSKLGSNRFLRIAEENKYPITSSEQVFFDSVISLPRFKNDQGLLRFQSSPEQQVRVMPLSTVTSNSLPVTRYPDLYQFVLRHIRAHPKYAHVTIPEIIEHPHGRWLTFPIKGSKWCDHVNRCHKNNRPYFSVSLDTSCIYAMCHSNNCSGYRSPLASVPQELINQVAK